MTFLIGYFRECCCFSYVSSCDGYLGCRHLTASWMNSSMDSMELQTRTSAPAVLMRLITRFWISDSRPIGVLHSMNIVCPRAITILSGTPRQPGDVNLKQTNPCWSQRFIRWSSTFPSCFPIGIPFFFRETPRALYDPWRSLSVCHIFGFFFVLFVVFNARYMVHPVACISIIQQL